MSAQPNALKTKISTPLFAATRDWFVRVLAMRVVEAWDDPGDCGCILALGDGPEQALLEIWRTETAFDVAGLSLQFRVDDLERFIAALPNDVVRRGPVARPWGSLYLYLADPNGIGVVVYQGGY